MAFKIIWSTQACEDLRDIVTFIALDNPQSAESIGNLLISKVELLVQFPQLGRVVPEEKNPDVRELIFSPYRIVYQILAEQQAVAIARIWHGARGDVELPDKLSF